MITAEMNAMTGTVMLEAMWEAKRKDLIDLVSPLVLYGIAKTTSPNGAVQPAKVVEIMEKFGYIEMPPSIVTNVCRRRKRDYFRKENGKYYRVGSLDDIVNDIDRRRVECEERVKAVSANLSKYLSIHCRRNKAYNEEEAVKILQGFFASHGLHVGLNRIEENEISYKTNEEEYYVAQYIIEKKKEDAPDYAYLVELARGYFLKSALYLQSRNNDAKTVSYKDVEIYYDTPFLIRLLGCQSEEEENEALMLHSAVLKQNAKCYYYPHVYEELLHILDAYKYSLMGRNLSTQTLEGLDAKGYSPDAVMRFKNSLSSKLSGLQIKEKDTFPLPTKDNDCVDVEKVIAEEEIKDYIKGKITHKYKEINLENDVNAAMSIHRQRGGKPCQSIEKAIAIFVTTNSDFAKAFNEYYKNNVSDEVFPLVLTSSFLAAITWVKSGKIDKLPELQLLKNAYASMKPSEEVLQKFEQLLQQMVENEQLTPEMAKLISTDHFIKKELSMATFGDEEKVTENFVEKAEEILKKRLTEDYEKESKEKMEKERRERAEKKSRAAEEYAEKKRDILKSIMWGIVSVIVIALIVVAVIAQVKSIPSISIGAVVSAAFACLSILDVVASRKGYIYRLVQKECNRFYTYCLEKKKREYADF